jgi:hypothetical protein
MSESFRDRIKRNERLLNQLTDYEKKHELEWCPISDEMLKEMYTGECDSQADRDRKAETMPQEEFEILFDATMQRYRKLKRKKKGQQQEGEEGITATEEGRAGKEEQQAILIEERA